MLKVYAPILTAGFVMAAAMHCRRAGCQRLARRRARTGNARDRRHLCAPIHHSQFVKRGRDEFGFLHAVVQADGDLMNALVTATLRAAMLALSFMTECMSTCGCDYAKALGSATSSLRLRRRLAGMVRHGDRRGDRGRVSPWRVRAPAVRSSASAQGYRQVAVRALLGIRGPA